MRPYDTEMASGAIAEDTGFTPGPWKACKPLFGYQDVRQDPANWDGRGYQLICTVPQSRKGSHYGEMFKANARLISAAPELYTELNELAGAFPEFDTDEPVSGADVVEYLAERWPYILAAIRKADGE